MGFYKKSFLGCSSIIILTLVLWFSRWLYFGDDTSGKQVFLVGLDGATWDVISPMITNGQLTNIQKLMQEGSYGILRSEIPTRSPAIWTTMVTGKSRREHGVTDFTVRLGKGTEGSVPVTSSTRKVKALWNILTENGFSIGLINWWATWPVEELNGFIISDRAFYKGVKNTTYPPVLQDRLPSLPSEKSTLLYDEINKIFGVTDISYKRNFFVNIFDNADPLMEMPPKVLDKDTSVFEIGAFLYKEFLPDFSAFYFKGSDILSHRYWKYYRPHSAKWRIKPSEGDIRRYGNVIPEYYRFIDKIIGEIIKLKDTSATIIIVSDHGFGPRPDEGGLDYDFNFVLEQLGLLKYKDGASKEIDYDKTIIYNDALPWRNAKLFLNFKNKQIKGLLNCRNYHSFTEKIKEKLEKIKVAEGGMLFSKVSAGKKGNNCFDVRKPDLFAKINYQVLPNMEAIINGRHYPTSRFIFKREISGSHQIPVQRTDGIIILSGKNIKQDTKINNATIYDITPSILYLFGLPLAKDMKGTVLEGAIEEAFLRANPPHYISTYEDLQNTKKIKGQPQKSQVDGQIIDELKALGYIK